MQQDYPSIRHRWIETLSSEGRNDAATYNASTVTQTPIPLSSVSSTSHTSSSMAIVGILVIVGLFIILAFSMWYITWFTIRYYRQRKLRREVLSIRAAHFSGNDNEENQLWYVDDTPTIERMQRRYETIEHWMITKRALDHTACCSTIQAQQRGSNHSIDNFPSKVTDEEMNVESVDTDTVADRECPICMSQLESGQFLSWSSNPECIHVYHHECIKEWLLRHNECCLCKQTYLPIDAKNKQLSSVDKNETLSSYVNELSQQFRASVAMSYYCLDHGLVRIPESFYCTQSELEQLERHIIGSTVLPIDLITFRGNNHECVASATHGPTQAPEIQDARQEQDANIDIVHDSVSIDETTTELNAEIVSATETDDSCDVDSACEKMEANT